MRKWLRWTLGIPLVLSLLAGGFWWEENWRGRRTWEETSARLRAAGQPLELSEIIPPLIPDEENVAAAPIFAEVFANKDAARLTRMHSAFSVHSAQPKTRPLLPEDMSHVDEWRDYLRTAFAANTPATEMAAADEVLHYLQPWKGEFQEVHAALERPKCRWPRYDVDPDGANLSLISSVIGFNFAAKPRAVAFAAKGDGDAYVTELIAHLRMGKVLSGNGTYLIGLLVRATSDAMALALLQNHIPVLHFNDRQLLALQQQLALIQMSDVKRTYRDEIVYDVSLARNITAEQIEQSMAMFSNSPFAHWPNGPRHVADRTYVTLMACRPEGWKFADAAMLAELLHDEVLPCIDESAGTILASRMTALNAAEERIGKSAGLFSICRLGGPSTTVTLLSKAARHQALARKAFLWCAIERFRLKHGRLPDRLEELAPNFVEKIPCDPVNGLPLKYVRKGQQDYLLYSIGWDGKDDGGVVRNVKDEGDWTWASDPTLIVNPDEEMRKAEESGDAAKRDAEWNQAVAKRNAQFRAKELINQRERAKAATGPGSK